MHTTLQHIVGFVETHACNILLFVASCIYMYILSIKCGINWGMCEIRVDKHTHSDQRFSCVNLFISTKICKGG